MTAKIPLTAISVFAGEKWKRSEFGILLLIAVFILSCHPRPSSMAPHTSIRQARTHNAAAMATAILLDQSETEHHLILWTKAKGGGITSRWIRGNRNGATQLGHANGLFLPIAQTVLEIRTAEADIPLCDCTTPPKTEIDSNSTSADSTCVPSNRTARITWPESIDKRTGKAVDLVPLPFDPLDPPALEELSFTASLTATIGPYGFLKIQGHTTLCGKQGRQFLARYAVVNLQTGSPVTLFSKAESAFLLEHEQKTALEQMNPAVRHVEDLFISAIYPVFLNGLGMTLAYEFSVNQSPVLPGGSWLKFGRTVRVDAETIPEAILPFAVLPDGLKTIYIDGVNSEAGGWMPIAADDAQIRTLINAIFGVIRED